jgi:hypothetical protein
MDNKALLEIILSKEGANEALDELSSQFNLNDSNNLKNNWSAVEELLLNFRLKKYSISQDMLFSETIIQPFKTSEEIEEMKKLFFN